MRPGSPVRSPAQQVKMAQLLWANGGQNGTRLALAERNAALTPAKVWVALATYTKAIAVNNAVATAPISGGPQAIFNRPQATVEQVNTAEVVGVGSTLDEAQQAVGVHKAIHSQLQAEYSIAEHRVGPPEVPMPLEPPPLQPYPCIGGCGTLLTGGVSFCQPCREKQWANSGWRPTSKDE